MKRFKQIISEVEMPKSGKDKRFLDKHKTVKIPHPTAGDEVFKGTTKKSKTNRASYEDGEDKKVYESAKEKRINKLTEAFRKGDKVRILNPHEERFGEVGTVHRVDKGKQAQTVRFADGQVESFNDDELVAEKFEMELKDGTIVEMVLDDIEAINDLSEDLNEANRKAMENLLMMGKDGFDEVLHFAREIR